MNIKEEIEQKVIQQRIRLFHSEKHLIGLNYYRSVDIFIINAHLLYSIASGALHLMGPRLDVV